MPAIDPTFAVGGPEWSVGSVEGLGSDGGSGGLTGAATDPASTVMTIERARLSMQLASQIRTKGVEALQEIFHTSV